ncbi:MAG: hypothetical protein MJ212_05255, partial [Alphaproteobacteria bacterium]|nr:hypothetical protein [Alphaproteobacteria bacterium]
MSSQRKKELDIIIPISIDIDSPDYNEIMETILFQNKEYGFTRFALSGPSGGFRSKGYPPLEHYEKLARMSKRVIDDLSPLGIECGWWITATIKGGLSDEFSPMVKSDGTTTPFSNCPLDPNFQEGFAKRVALFAKIAKPAFIITEDDYSIHASTWSEGCFCEYHLKEFAKRAGKYYSREQLNAIFENRDEESLRLLKIFRDVSKYSLVSLAKAIRRELDKESPEIPMGTMQSGYADKDGDTTYELAKAFAGDKHIPFSRVHGTFYGKVDVPGIPARLFNPLYTKQSISNDFIFIHESDTFPHTRFFKSGNEMKVIMSGAYSYGFDGSTFQTAQILDHPIEEHAFGDMFAKERKRFNEVRNIAKQCEIQGVQLCFDPFYNTVDDDNDEINPFWLNCLPRFGVPYTTKESNVVFWDCRQARYYDDQTILKTLSKNLFLDGEAAKILCERGYGKYLGVEIGDEKGIGKQSYDLGEREIICDGYLAEMKGRNMPSAHMLSPEGNGKLFEVKVIDSQCEVLTKDYTFEGKYICDSMTRFENELGGKIIVMGMTLRGNFSQSLLNYRRKRIFEDLLVWCDKDSIFVKDEPRIFIIANKAKAGVSDLKGMLTLTNLSSDNLESLQIHLPKELLNNTEFMKLDINGKWIDANVTILDDGIVVDEKF